MEPTACFKNLIPKAIRDAFSVMLVTQTTLGPQWEGTTQGHRPGGGSHGRLHVDAAVGSFPAPPPPTPTRRPQSPFPWLTVTPQRQARACYSLSSTFQCLPCPKSQSPNSECGRFCLWPFFSPFFAYLPFASFGSALPRDPPPQFLLKISFRCLVKSLSERLPLIFCLPASQG